MVNDPQPGPAPAALARINNSRLTRPSWRTWPHRKLRKEVPRVDGAFAAQPTAPAVPPTHNASASSMQSPAARADAARASILSPAFARPGASPRSTWLSTCSPSPRHRAWSTLRPPYSACQRQKVCSEIPMQLAASTTALPAAMITPASLSLLMISSAVCFLFGISDPPFCPASQH